MYFCEPCRQKNKWPQGYALSRGPCEVCGTMSDCYDLHHSLLPIPERPTEVEIVKNKS